MLPRYVLLLFALLFLTHCNSFPNPEPKSAPVPTSILESETTESETTELVTSEPETTQSETTESVTSEPETTESESEPVLEPTIASDSDTTAIEATPEPVAIGTIAVGSRDFTEQLILGQIIIALLQDAGFDVVDKTGLGGTNTAHDALKNGDVDIIWEYIGTILAESHGVPANSLPTDVDVALDMVSALDARHHNLLWLKPSAFNDTYTLMMKPDTVADGMVSLEDLATFMNENDAPLTLCVENEFYSRNDGLYPLQDHYGFAFKEEKIEIVSYDHLYEGLRDGLCDVAEGFSTDGRISAWGFQTLVDSKQFFPVYNASPIIRQSTLEQYPELKDLLNELGSYLDDDTMTLLNERVDLGHDGVRSSGDEELPAAVAVDFLTKAGLVGERPQIAVGSRDFTEQLVLGQILIRILEEAGFEVIDKTALGGTNTSHDALKNGEVDVIWEYIGTILSESHGVPSNGLPTNSETGFEMVSALDKRHHNLIWMEPSLFNDTYTFMIKNDSLPEEILTLEDLALYMNQNDSPLRLCVENEFYSRGDGLFPLQEHYGFAFKEENIELVAYDTLYEGLRDGLCDVAEGFSTDGRISAWGFQNLVDNKEFFPAYHAAPIVREDTLTEHPEINNLLGKVATYIDDETMTLLNARVDVGADGVRNSGDEATPEEVADDFLQKTGLIGGRPQLVVGSRDFTEQLLLGQISIALLEEAGYIVVDKTGLGGTNSGYDALNKGEIDLIWEYTGTALAEFHEIPAEDLPTDPTEAWQKASTLDDLFGLVWLTPGEFNDTYTFMVRAEDSKLDNVQNLEELAELVKEDKSDEPLKLCVENEFYSRADGLYPLQAHYDFEFQEENIEIVAYDQLYEGLRDGLCDVAEGFSTDGRISAWGFRNLVDSKQFFPAYNAAPIIRKQALVAQPQIAQLFEEVSPHLDNDTITRLNQRIDIGSDGERNSGDEESIRSVAELFLCEIGTLKQGCPATTIASVEESTSSSEEEVETEETASEDATSEDETSEEADSENAASEDETSEEVASEDTTSEDETSEEVASEDTTSEEIASEDATGEDAASEDAASEDTTNEDTTSEEVASQDTTSEEAASEDATGEDTTNEDTTSEDAASEDATDEEATSEDAASEDATSEDATDEEATSEDAASEEVASEDATDEEATSEEVASEDATSEGTASEDTTNEEATSEEASEDATSEGTASEDTTNEEATSEEASEEVVLVCENILLNGEFEADTDWVLSAGRIPAKYSTEQSHQDKFAVRLGTTEANQDGHSTANQRIILPENATSASLTFWYYPISQDEIGGDLQGAQLYDASFTFSREVLLKTISNEQKWVRKATDLTSYIGEEINLHFYVINDGDAVGTAMYLDDVSLDVCYERE